MGAPNVNVVCPVGYVIGFEMERAGGMNGLSPIDTFEMGFLWALASALACPEWAMAQLRRCGDWEGWLEGGRELADSHPVEVSA